MTTADAPLSEKFLEGHRARFRGAKVSKVHVSMTGSLASKGHAFESTWFLSIEIGHDDGALPDAYSEYDGETRLSPGFNLHAARVNDDRNFWGRILIDYVNDILAGGHGGAPVGDLRPEVIANALWPDFKRHVVDRLADEAIALRNETALQIVRHYTSDVPEDALIEQHRLAVCAAVGVPDEFGGPPTA